MAPSDPYIEPIARDFNLARYCIAQSDARPDHALGLTFIADERSHEWTWGALRARCAQWQRALLEQGVQRGDRVALLLPNGVDTPLALLAAAAMGAIPIVLSPQLKTPELRFILQDATPLLLVTSAPMDLGVAELTPGALSTAPALEGGELVFADTGPDTPGYMVYTSGTTGNPRGVLHAHRAVWGRRPMREGWTGITGSDRVLHAGQLNWTYAMGITVFDTWPVGGHALIYEGPRNAATWGAILRTHRPSIFAAVPGLYRQLLRDLPSLASDTRSLRHALCAGEPLPPSLHQDWVQTTGLELYEALGMSEVSTYISSGPSTPTRPGSPGRPQAGRRVAVLPLDGGEAPLGAGRSGVLAVHRDDPGLMLRYWNSPDATQAAFRGPWFLTGDCARFDEDGYLWYEGRSDDIINALGYRVGPAEVEAALAQHPAIREVAVCGLEVRPGVTLVAAYLVFHPEFTSPNEAALTEFAKARLADYKQPRVWRALSALPRGRTGKVLRRELSAAWEREQAS